jgi:putative transposase
LFGPQPHVERALSYPPTCSSSKRCATSSAFTSTRQDKALVLCVDEKSQIQGLERTQPVLAMGLGYRGDPRYFCHGIVSLFAALDIITGGVISQCKPHHLHQEFMSFLKHLDTKTPAELALHRFLDNYATHKHPWAKTWFARHPPFHLHFTPTYSS